MRLTSRLFATVANSTRQYLRPNDPTGLTGILTHPFPRPTLLYLYHTTLSKLREFPELSVYRQATEALTKQRLAVVESTVPEGFEEWQDRIEKQLPEIEQGKARGDVRRLTIGGRPYLFQSEHAVETDDRSVEWDGEQFGERGEGPRPMADKTVQHKDFTEARHDIAPEEVIEVENEPALTSDQIMAIETKIGAGLIEEIILVAERELELTYRMLESKPWEELEEKPAEGQWQYFERVGHTGSTKAS